MDVLQAQENFLHMDVPKVLAQLKRQADAIERIAMQFEELMAFLHGTTIQQVEEKRKEMRKQVKSKKTDEVKSLKQFQESN